MKTLTLFFFIVLTTVLTTNAQITKGNWMVGGDASFFTNKTEYDPNENINTSEVSYLMASPNLGYFFVDKLAGGIDLQFYFVDSGKSVNSQSYGFGPYLRYYFLETEKRINLFSQLNYNFGVSKSGSGLRTNSNGYGLQIGTCLFFNSSVGLEFSLNYSDTKNTLDKTFVRKTKQFLVGLGFQIHLEK
ncbi:hypothetical protein [Yeosuana marina]|uniref:hypothetical protein n=1 Tax=Yeosuana marina TaxID=1565536 RepID=UPI0030C86076